MSTGLGGGCCSDSRGRSCGCGSSGFGLRFSCKGSCVRGVSLSLNGPTSGSFRGGSGSTSGGSFGTCLGGSCGEREGCLSRGSGLSGGCRESGSSSISRVGSLGCLRLGTACSGLRLESGFSQGLSSLRCCGSLDGGPSLCASCRVGSRCCSCCGRACLSVLGRGSCRLR